MDRELPEFQEARLKQMCGLPPHKPLPKKLAEAYWPLKIVLDRIGTNRVSDDLLAKIAVEAGYGELTKREANPTLVDLWRTKRVKKGDAVIAKYGGKDVACKIFSVNHAGDEIGVLFEGEPNETKLKADQVALAAV